MKERLILCFKLIEKVVLKVASVMLAFGTLCVIAVVFKRTGSRQRVRSSSFLELLNRSEKLLEACFGVIKGLTISGFILIWFALDCIVLYIRHLVVALIKRKEKLKNPVVFLNERLIIEGFVKKQEETEEQEKENTV